jgi:acetate---CoA ligase (ADP-forming)
MPRELTALFYPKSVAVIGASRAPEKLGAIVLKNIINSGFSGKIYPVNPNTDSINDLECFSDIQSIPEIPELGVVALPASQVADAIKHLGAKGTKNAVVYAAGFKETGSEGEKLEKELADICQKFGINLLGPNCLGFVNNLHPINATFGEPVSNPGNLRFITQSGAIAAGLFDWCQSTGLGFSEFVTLGNKTVLNENDMLEYFQSRAEGTLHDFDREGLSSVSPIGLYLEDITDGPEFLKITSQIAKKDPILILKPGKTQAAAEAMQSHTGAIAGEDDVLDAVLEQSGVLRCETLEEFFDLTRAFSWENIPVGPNVAVISNAGGPAVISADAVINAGLELAEFDEETKKQLSEILPRSASLMNPVDVLGDALADRFAEASEIILQKESVHSLVVILTPQLMTQVEKTAELIGNLSKKYQKPIFCSFIGGRLVAEGEQKLNGYKIPSFRFPEQAISALGTMWKFKKQREAPEEITAIQPAAYEVDKEKVRQVIDNAVKQKQQTLDNIQANEILSAAGILTPPSRITENLEEAVKAAQEFGWPVVAKLSAPGLLHKRNIGGVITDIRNESQLEDTWHMLERNKDHLDEKMRENVKVQIQKEVANGVEVIVGIKRDPTFGPVMLFGAGGSLAELVNDKNLHLLPLEISQIKKLVEKSKVYTLLKDREHEPAHALPKLYELMERFVNLTEQIPEFTEIEINPVIVTYSDVWAVDGKVLLKKVEPKPPAGPKFQTATTTEHTVLATTYRHYEFEADEPLNFLPGQYITVKVAQDAVRCYSIAGSNNPKHFVLLVDIAPGGPGSKFFEHLKVGDKITYLGPFGVFTLRPDDGAKNLLFLGTGSGFSPLRSLIDAALTDEKLKDATINLYVGLNHNKDIFWEDYYRRLEKEHPNFKFQISICYPDENWIGHKGFITELVEKDFPDAKNCAAYMCGNKNMINDISNLLTGRGMPKERIYVEML